MTSIPLTCPACNGRRHANHMECPLRKGPVTLRLKEGA